MKRLIGLILVLLFSLSALGDTCTPDQSIMKNIRDNFYLAIHDDPTTISLIKYIEDKFPGDRNNYPPVILAYYAALQGLRGKHSAFLPTKYERVKNSIPLMDSAVKKQPDCLEAHFLRYAFYEQIPALFGVKDQVSEDLKTVIHLLAHRDCKFVCSEVQRDMISYILTTAYPSQTQRAQLQKIFKGFAQDERISLN